MNIVLSHVRGEKPLKKSPNKRPEARSLVGLKEWDSEARVHGSWDWDEGLGIRTHGFIKMFLKGLWSFRICRASSHPVIQEIMGILISRLLKRARNLLAVPRF